MTVIAALFSGISGIATNGSALSISGDNIANMSTPGFKAAVPVFESALSQQIGSAEIGLGGRLAGSTANFGQGAFSNTTRGTDLAIQGRGFFIVNSVAGEAFYTRAGIFERNGNGDLVTSAGGFVLQGYSIDPTTGSVSGTLSDINIQAISTSPTATSQVVYRINLNSETTLASGAFDGSSHSAAEGSSDFSTSVTAFDSLGNTRTLVTYFRHTDNNTWTYHTLINNTDLATNVQFTGSGASTATVILEEGTLVFSNQGGFSTKSLVVSAGSATLYTGGANMTAAGFKLSGSAQGFSQVALQWGGGAASITSFELDFGQATGTTALVTQYASASSVNSITQDGGAQGELNSIDFDEDGTISGSFSNGTTRPLFAVPLAVFANEEGLRRAGNNLFDATTDSGTAQVGLAQTGGRGELRPFAIEQSNVDLATEFVKIITYQRAFQASARTISTAAELLQDLVNLGR